MLFAFQLPCRAEPPVDVEVRHGVIGERIVLGAQNPPLVYVYAVVPAASTIVGRIGWSKAALSRTHSKTLARHITPPSKFFVSDLTKEICVRGCRPAEEAVAAPASLEFRVQGSKFKANEA